MAARTSSAAWLPSPEGPTICDDDPPETEVKRDDEEEEEVDDNGGWGTGAPEAATLDKFSSYGNSSGSSKALARLKPGFESNQVPEAEATKASRGTLNTSAAWKYVSNSPEKCALACPLVSEGASARAVWLKTLHGPNRMGSFLIER